MHSQLVVPAAIVAVLWATGSLTFLPAAPRVTRSRAVPLQPGTAALASFLGAEHAHADVLDLYASGVLTFPKEQAEAAEKLNEQLAAAEVPETVKDMAAEMARRDWDKSWANVQPAITESLQKMDFDTGFDLWKQFMIERGDVIKEDSLEGGTMGAEMFYNTFFYGIVFANVAYATWQFILYLEQNSRAPKRSSRRSQLVTLNLKQNAPKEPELSTRVPAWHKSNAVSPMGEVYAVGKKYATEEHQAEVLRAKDEAARRAGEQDPLNPNGTA